MKSIAPGSILIILISITLLFLCFYFAFYFLPCIFIPKIPKILSIISIRSHSRKWPWRDWQPLIALVARIYLFCAWSPTGLIPWFSKTEGNTYATLLHHPFLFRGKPTQCSRGSKKDFWRRCRGCLHKSLHTKYPSHTLISRITLFAICLSFSSPPLHLCLFFAFFLYVPLFVFPHSFYLFARNLLIWIHLKCSTWIIFDPYALMLKPQLA